MKTQIEKAMQWFNDQGIRAFITKHDNGSETLSIRMGSFDIVVSDNEIAHRANLYTIDNPDTPTYRFPRVCSISGKGMWEGYCFGYGEVYIADKWNAEDYATKTLGYNSLEEAYEDDAFYWTEWQDLDEDGWYESEHQDGRDAVWVSADGELPSVTIEFGSIVYEFNPSERDEWQSDGDYDYHYELDDNRVSVYKVNDGDTDTSKVLYTQRIRLFDSPPWHK